MDEELAHLTMPLYAETEEDAREEHRRRVEVFLIAQEVELDMGEVAYSDELMEKVIPVPLTSDLERVYRLAETFEVSYRCIGDLDAQALELMDRFLKAHADLQAKELELFMELGEAKFGDINWDAPPLEILERERDSE